TGPTGEATPPAPAFRAGEPRYSNRSRSAAANCRRRACAGLRLPSSWVGAMEPAKPTDHVRTVAILGASGQLGTDLVEAWAHVHQSDRVVGLSHGDVQVEDPESVRHGLLAIGPQLVVN